MDPPIEITKHYKDTVELLFNKKEHSYTANGELVDGTTTPLGIISKPGILYWAVDKTIEFLDKGWDINGDYDEITKADLLSEARFAHRRSLKTAANTGSLVHLWIERFIKATLAGEKIPPLPKNEVARNSCKLFYAWYKKHNVKFIFSEKKILSLKYKYAGTCDTAVEINGKRFIGDVKTSSGIYPEMFLQTGAYQIAHEEEFGDKWDGNIIIRCGQDGVLEIAGNVDHDGNKKGFLYALMLYRKIKQMEKEKKEFEKQNKGIEHASFLKLIGEMKEVN